MASWALYSAPVWNTELPNLSAKKEKVKMRQKIEKQTGGGRSGIYKYLIYHNLLK